jgi:hypothetical protein
MKSRLLPLSGLIGLMVIFTACTIEQTYHFKSDFSGSYSMRFDLSAMAGLGDSASSQSTTDTIFTPESLDEMRNAYLTVPGVSNATATYDNNVLESGFEFSNLKALNEAVGKGSGESEESKGIYHFTQNGKKLIMKINRDGMAEFNGEEMASMGEMVTFKLAVSFERDIKKVKGDIAQWTKGSKEVLIEFPLKTLSDPKTNLDVEILLK